MKRRLVNLAMIDSKNHIFSLHRMDLSKLLFYPSTAEAEAAAGRSRIAGDKGKPQKIGKLRLPPPIMGFEPFPTSSDPFLMPHDGSMFALLHGRSSEPSRIFFASSEGQASLYDVDSRSVISVPDLTAPTRSRDSPVVTGAGEKRLYMMRSHGPFDVLDFTGGTNGSSGSLLWKPLPPVPDAVTGIRSFTVVDGGRIICVSSAARWEDRSTFCFDTVSQEWWHAGDWILPFEGRAEYVPELDTWFGFSDDHPHHLCAADLSGVAMVTRQAPEPQQVWEDYEPPSGEETSVLLNKDYPDIVLTTSVRWEVSQFSLVNLGSGRFCVAKVLFGGQSESLSWSFDTQNGLPGTFTVLTGIEVIRGSGDGELRMVKHKTRELVHPGLEVACVL